jgi:hypothetical protein
VTAVAELHAPAKNWHADAFKPNVNVLDVALMPCSKRQKFDWMFQEHEHEHTRSRCRQLPWSIPKYYTAPCVSHPAGTALAASKACMHTRLNDAVPLQPAGMNNHRHIPQLQVHTTACL